jgi:hypothetical protein
MLWLLPSRKEQNGHVWFRNSKRCLYKNSYGEIYMKKTQIEQVKEFLLNGWTTAYFMASALGASDSGITARIRDLRKSEYGGFNVIKRKLPHRNVWQYRIIGG